MLISALCSEGDNFVIEFSRFKSPSIHKLKKNRKRKNMKVKMLALVIGLFFALSSFGFAQDTMMKKDDNMKQDTMMKKDTKMMKKSSKRKRMSHKRRHHKHKMMRKMKKM